MDTPLIKSRGAVVHMQLVVETKDQVSYRSGRLIGVMVCFVDRRRRCTYLSYIIIVASISLSLANTS